MTNYTQQQIEDQFTKDLEPPDPTKGYIVSSNIKTTGVTLLMKCILLAKNYQYLLDSIDIDKELEKKTCRENGWNALHVATINSGLSSSEYAVSKLLENKVDINSLDNHNQTPLFIAS